MKVAKIKKHEKNKKAVVEESYSMKNMLSLILVVLVAFILFYVITYFVVKKDVVEQPSNNNTEIDSTKITFNNLLNRNEDSYYVLAYKTKVENEQANYKNLYDNYINNYINRSDSLSFYYIDIDDAFNKNYIGTETNITDDLGNLKIADEVLFRIKDGKIEKTYIGKDKIIDKLSRL